MSADAQAAFNEMLDVLQACWDTYGSGITLFPPNYTGTTPEDSGNAVQPFARTYVNHLLGSQAAIGHTYFANVGLLTVALNYPLSSANADMRPFATRILNAFRGTKTPSGVRFRDCAINELPARGKWAAANVVATFYYDELV